MKNSNLITIQSIEFNDEIVKTVNARELHSYLQSKQDFSTWIKKRIKDYGFIENIDFVRFHKKMEANNATVIDYAITIDVCTFSLGFSDGLINRSFLDMFLISYNSKKLSLLYKK